MQRLDPPAGCDVVMKVVPQAERKYLPLNQAITSSLQERSSQFWSATAVAIRKKQLHIQDSGNSYAGEFPLKNL